MKKQIDLPTWIPGLQEVAPIIEDLKKSSRLRKIVEKQKKIEETAAKPLKRLMLKLGLGRYTKRLNDLRNSLHESEWTVLRVAHQLREEKRRSRNESSFGFDSENKQNFLDAYKKFNNFCLGVTAFDPELAVKIEMDDAFFSLMDSPQRNPFNLINF